MQTVKDGFDDVTKSTGISFRDSDINTQLKTYGENWSDSQLSSESKNTPSHGNNDMPFARVKTKTKNGCLL